jgi:hypothetical protein
MRMSATISLVYMATNKTAKMDAGRIIAARRAYLGKSGPAIEKETNGVIYTKLLSRIETGVTPIEQLPFAKIGTLCAALKWTLTEFLNETGITHAAPEPIPGASDPSDTVRLPNWGAVSAGVQAQRKGGSMPEKAIPVNPDAIEVNERDVARLGCLRYEGAMMLTAQAAEALSRSTVLIVEWGAFPAGDDLVVGWVPELSQAGLKRANEGPDAVLGSNDPDGPVVRLGVSDFEPRGVVRWLLRRP